jgi:FixJ family two-component response regulator
VIGTENEPVVAVVDDERPMREAAENLLRSAGFRAECFASAEDFLQSPRLGAISCLVLDISLPGMNGLQLQLQLRKQGLRVPIVFVTASEDNDGRMRVRAMQAGAIAFLRKPFSEQALLDAVRLAVRS